MGAKLKCDIGVMNRSQALQMLGISQEQDDEFQAKFLNGGRPKKPPTKRVIEQKLKEDKTYKDELQKRIEVLEEKVRLINQFLVI